MHRFSDDATRTRILAILSLLLITPLGFACKAYGGPLHGWVNDSIAGVFYEIFWCLVVLASFPGARAFLTGAAVLVVTSVLEFLQLSHNPFLEGLRTFYFGKVLLGTTFSWWDFPYYFVGCVLGGSWIKWLQKPVQGRGRSSS